MPKRHRRTRRQSDTAPVASLFALLVLGCGIANQTLHIPWRWGSVAGVFLITIGLFFGRRARQRAQRRTEERLLLADTFSLTPTEFEVRVKHLLTYLGWDQVQHRGGSGDGGVDLVGIRNGERCIVQCKLYRDLVAPEFLRALEGTRLHERADRAFLVTTGRVAHQGRAWIQDKPIEVWDGAYLTTLFHNQRAAGGDPARQQRAQRRTMRFTAGLALVNVVTVLLAFSLPMGEVARPQTEPVQAVPGQHAEQASSAPVAIASRSADTQHADRDPLTCGDVRVTGVKMLLLRTAPRKDAQEIMAYPAGTDVTLLCSAPVSADGIDWRNVRIGQSEGWMSGHFLK